MLWLYFADEIFFFHDKLSVYECGVVFEAAAFAFAASFAEVGCIARKHGGNILADEFFVWKRGVGADIERGDYFAVGIDALQLAFDVGGVLPAFRKLVACDWEGNVDFHGVINYRIGIIVLE